MSGDPTTPDPAARRTPFRLLAAACALPFALPAFAGEESRPSPERAPADPSAAEAAVEAGAGGQDAPAEQAPVDFHFRLRGQLISDSDDSLEDIALRRGSVWSHTRIGDRIGVRATYDVGDSRVHDLWAQLDVTDWLAVRAGRSAPLWLREFTDAPFAFQMVDVSFGAGETRVRDNGVFLFANHGTWSGGLHVITGGGWDKDENSWRDVLGHVRRTFGPENQFEIDVGHYEGRDGPDGALIPRRQTAVEFDGEIDDYYIRAALFVRTRNERTHVGGFYRLRTLARPGLMVMGEYAFETNNGPADDSVLAQYLSAGSRYDLPWTLSHLTGQYRKYFGARSDHELRVMLQLIVDFKTPLR